MVFPSLPSLVRTCYIRENKFETLPGGGESVLYRLPDGRQVSNWELIRTPEYEAFKRGFRDGFEARQMADAAIEPPLLSQYQSGFRHGRREGKKQQG